MSKSYPPKETFNDADVDAISLDGDAFSLDEDDAAIVVSADDVTVHDLEDQHIHDQLPSVEELKARVEHQPVNSGKKRKIFLVASGLAVLVALITIIAVAVSKTSHSTSNTEIQGRLAEVENLLFENGISTLPALRERRSPQRLAAAFVADGDLFQAEMTGSGYNKFIERYVLAVLYYEFDGPEWTNNYNFLSARDHCEWSVVVSRPAGDFIKGVECNAEGRVIGLDLSNNNLNGYHIPNEIQHLKYMQKLHMHNNKLGGNIPYYMKEMKHLKSIGLMDAGLVGSIPEWFGDMTQLTTLALSQNEFHGSIPSSIAKLSDLRILGLDNLGLSGNIRPVKGLKKLEALYLEDNTLTGNLSSDMWPVIRELDVSNNMLDGSIPSSLFQHKHLTVLDLHQNLMIGSFPDDIVSQDTLEYVSLQRNSLTGPVSDRIGFLRSLKHLDISFNGLTGTLPNTIKELTSLRYLTTSGNNFSEQPMMDLSMMTDLQDLAMKGNNMIGTIQESLAMLSNLQLLDLDGNKLTGQIPTYFGLMRSLDHLLLNRNQLTGTLPSELGNLHGLKVFLVDGNNITGSAHDICSAPIALSHFTADCYPGRDGSKPELECRCCTLCCSDDDPQCNDKAWTSNYDPKYQYGYIRQDYTYSVDQAAEGWSKVAKEQAQAAPNAAIASQP
jgi:Leucine-rich repeat (LRR) protein